MLLSTRDVVRSRTINLLWITLTAMLCIPPRTRYFCFDIKRDSKPAIQNKFYDTAVYFVRLFPSILIKMFYVPNIIY
jgi:hypothetical protein